MLVAACLLAMTMASAAFTVRARKGLRRVPGLGWLTPPIRGVAFRSAWWRLFEEHPHEGHRIYVGCTLEDGSYVAGWLFSHAIDYEETADRDLILSGPVVFRPAGAGDGDDVELANVGAVVVSARRIVHLFVSYIPKPVQQQTVAVAGDAP